MSKSKSCDKCGYLGDDKYDDFFEYQKDGEKITICYFCIEMTATCEKNIKKMKQLHTKCFVKECIGF